ncbi:hypothetical protein LZZ90_09840 [Flavobacterium sp. SM15]|uniref:hypothetical protein n=1 Tax=Flavobacterium sp. SM15 TaxID=2908005 RepID=UPI001EDB13AA|nr:hypothetical protein [Flavobacterium sp. SM15]MCG2611804.1 hypothetical protein [Flavobacterium sp. SM15]
MKKTVRHLFSVIVITGFLFMAYGSGEDAAKAETVQEEIPSVGQETELENKPNWVYNEDQDKMEGTKQFFATCTSINTADFEFPYDGGSTLDIHIRNLGHGNEALITVSKGQFMTSIGDSESLKAKFDDEKPMSFTYSSSADGSSDVIFINNAAKFISKLKKAKKVMLEVGFFDAGRKVLEFETEGLKWNK